MRNSCRDIDHQFNHTSPSRHPSRRHRDHQRDGREDPQGPLPEAPAVNQTEDPEGSAYDCDYDIDSRTAFVVLAGDHVDAEPEDSDQDAQEPVVSVEGEEQSSDQRDDAMKQRFGCVLSQIQLALQRILQNL